MRKMEGRSMPETAASTNSLCPEIPCRKMAMNGIPSTKTGRKYLTYEDIMKGASAPKPWKIPLPKYNRKKAHDRIKTCVYSRIAEDFSLGNEAKRPISDIAKKGGSIFTK